MRNGKDIYFTRAVISLAFLGHQTLHLQNKFVFSSSGVIKLILLRRAGQKNPLFDPLVEKNGVRHEKNIFFFPS